MQLTIDITVNLDTDYESTSEIPRQLKEVFGEVVEKYSGEEVSPSPLSPVTVGEASDPAMDLGSEETAAPQQPDPATPATPQQPDPAMSFGGENPTAQQPDPTANAAGGVPAAGPGPIQATTENDLKQTLENMGYSVDVALVPYHKEIHSSSGKFYEHGSMHGRWQWKRGIDRDAAEKQAQQMAQQMREIALNAIHQNAGANGPAPAPTPAPQPTPPPAPAPAPQPAQAAPPPQQTQSAPSPQPDNGGNADGAYDSAGNYWNWVAFMKAMAPNNVTAEQVVQVVQPYGIEKLPQISTRPDLVVHAVEQLGMQPV